MDKHHSHIKLAFFYGMMFLVIGLYMPFFPVWLEGRNMSKSEITLLISIPLFTRIIFTPLLSFMTDHFGNRRLALIIMLWLSLGCCFLLTFFHDFYSLLFILIPFGIFWTTVMPVTEAIAMLQVRENGMNYGHIRLWGSLTFILASIAAGWLIDIKGSEIIWLALMLCITATLIAGYGLPKQQQQPKAQALEKTAPLPPISSKDFWILSKNPLFILFLFAGGLGQASHAFYYALGTLHWYSLGYSGLTIGALWAVGVIAEIILFIYYRRWFKRRRADQLLLAGASLAVIRWFLMAFNPPLWLLFGLQTFHAFSFAMIHLGAVHFISEAIPEKLSATAQGIYGAFAMGSLLGLLTLLSGPLYNQIQGMGYMAMAFSATIAAILSWQLTRKWRGETLDL